MGEFRSISNEFKLKKKEFLKSNHIVCINKILKNIKNIYLFGDKILKIPGC